MLTMLCTSTASSLHLYYNFRLRFSKMKSVNICFVFLFSFNQFLSVTIAKPFSQQSSQEIDQTVADAIDFASYRENSEPLFISNPGQPPEADIDLASDGVAPDEVDSSHTSELTAEPNIKNKNVDPLGDDLSYGGPIASTPTQNTGHFAKGALDKLRLKCSEGSVPVCCDDGITVVAANRLKCSSCAFSCLLSCHKNSD